MTIPEPSKRPFRHPVPFEALEYFCHPDPAHLFATPAWGRDSKLYVSNCHLALRFFNFTAAHGPGPMAAVDRLLKQAWHSGKYEDATAWRKLDDCTLDLFREGLFSMWDISSGKPRFRIDPPARVNHGFVCPAASLQAISRLPRCEIYTRYDRGMPLAFRFNGGEGLIAPLSYAQQDRMTDTVCHVFAGRRD